MLRVAIADKIAVAMKATRTRSKVDVQSLAIVIEGILRGVALQWLADPDAIDLEATIAMASAMIRSQIGGLSSR
jgi:hypothetical protein